MPTFTKRITANGDDGMGNAGNFSSGLTTLRIGNDGAIAWDVWTTFLVVTIPVGSSISNAKVTFEANDNDAGNTVRTNIYCNDIDTAVSPTNSGELVALARTTASTVWDGEGAWTAGVTYDTPDFASAVQEVIDRPGWVSGNDLMVLIDDDGSDASALRRPKSLEHAGTNVEALLTIEYVVGFIPRTGGIF